MLNLSSNTINTQPFAGHKLWIERDRYHTAIVLTTELVREMAAELLPVLNDQPLVRFGWGDRGYYGISNKNIFKAFTALFVPTRSVMEVSTFAALEEVGEKIIELPLSDLNINKLLTHISQSFRWDAEGQPHLVRVSEKGFHYYAARGVYHMFKNCNNWTAKALKISGLRVRYLLAFFANSVIKQLE